ncbi:MAG: MFS transporter [Anaerolineae bacterium]
MNWSIAPATATSIQKQNFLNVQVDAVAIGLASAATPFLPVFLARLGASSFQVGLLTAMPALTGLIFALLIGRFLQTRRNVVPWFSLSRLLYVSAYALTGVAAFLVPQPYLAPVVLLIWAVATIPQTALNISFTVVMNAVAGPEHRYDLMSRRWSILGLTTAITVAIIGPVLDWVGFPLNYQLVFIALSIGGLISYYYSSHIELPDNEPPASPHGQSWAQRFKGYINLIRSEPKFVSFTAKQFVFTAGTALATPLLPLYYVREVHASDTWIGFFSTAQTATVLMGYFLWTRESKSRGGRFVLLCTTLGLALYPGLTALTHQPGLIAFYAALSGVFQAGLNLVFFDEQMKTVPPQHSATFVSLGQSSQNLATVAGPLLGTLLADQIGIGNALFLSALLRLLGFVLFAGWYTRWSVSLKRRGWLQQD